MCNAEQFLEIVGFLHFRMVHKEAQSNNSFLFSHVTAWWRNELSRVTVGIRRGQCDHQRSLPWDYASGVPPRQYGTRSSPDEAPSKSTDAQLLTLGLSCHYLGTQTRGLCVCFVSFGQGVVAIATSIHFQNMPQKLQRGMDRRHRSANQWLQIRWWVLIVLQQIGRWSHACSHISTVDILKQNTLKYLRRCIIDFTTTINTVWGGGEEMRLCLEPHTELKLSGILIHRNGWMAERIQLVRNFNIFPTLLLTCKCDQDSRQLSFFSYVYL